MPPALLLWPWWYAEQYVMRWQFSEVIKNAGCWADLRTEIQMISSPALMTHCALCHVFDLPTQHTVAKDRLNFHAWLPSIVILRFHTQGHHSSECGPQWTTQNYWLERNESKKPANFCLVTLELGSHCADEARLHFSCPWPILELGSKSARWVAVWCAVWGGSKRSVNHLNDRCSNWWTICLWTVNWTFSNISFCSPLLLFFPRSRWLHDVWVVRVVRVQQVLR